MAVGCAGSSEEIVSVAPAAPAWDGAKRTVASQVAPGAIGAPVQPLTEKSAASPPATESEETDSP